MIAAPPPQIRPPVDTPSRRYVPSKKLLTKSDKHTKSPIIAPCISPPADTLPKKRLRNQIVPVRHHGFLRYVISLSVAKVRMSQEHDEHIYSALINVAQVAA